VSEDAPGPASRPAAPRARVGLSTASVYPESTATAFSLARELGYDAVEVMVGMDPVSQDVAAVRRLADYSDMPVSAVHAPCLLITQRVWGTDPARKLRLSAEMAKELAAETVVVHPPFRWQRDYSRDFTDLVARLEADTGIAFAVENMYPWRPTGREIQAYLPSWDPVGQSYANVTLDLSHTAIAGDALAMAKALGQRLRHVHLGDGTGLARDEHLVPGRGNQPCAELLEWLARNGFDRDIVVEINTRRAVSTQAREKDLAESLAFARSHLAAACGYALAGPVTEKDRLTSDNGS
jgi:sugar phosphate isomerase/epimerase